MSARDDRKQVRLLTVPRHTAQVQRADLGSEQVSNLLTGPQFESQRRLNPCGADSFTEKEKRKKSRSGEVAGRLCLGWTAGKFHCLGGSIPSFTKQETPAPLRIHQPQMHREGTPAGGALGLDAPLRGRQRSVPGHGVTRPSSLGSRWMPLALPLAHTDPGRRLWKQVSRVPSRRAPGRLYSLRVLCLKNRAVGPGLGHCQG